MGKVEEKLDAIKEEIENPKSLALLRRTSLENDSPGLPGTLLPSIRDVCLSWEKLAKTDPFSGEVTLANCDETRRTLRCLQLCKRIAEVDPTLNEELAREGLHFLLTRIAKLDPSILEREEDSDAVMDIQDMACDIASMSSSFPLQIAPFNREELRARLPLSFPIAAVEQEESSKPSGEEGICILIDQVKERQTAQVDVGFVMWPSAVALARWLVSNPSEVLSKNVLELGAGCGLTGLVAGSLKVEHGESTEGVVTLTDFNPTVVRNIEHNIALNGLQGIAKGAGLDFYAQDASLEGWLDMNGEKREQVDLILAADVICQPEDAFAAARSISCALKTEGKAIIVSANSKHRFGVERFEEACTEQALNVTVMDVQGLYDGRLLSSNMDKTTGYVEGMGLTMYIVCK